jgi:hypothetical protein
VYFSVDSAFRAHPADSLARIAARDTLYAMARRLLVDSVGPQLKTYNTRSLARVRLDNAALLAHRIYDTDLDLFDQVWVIEHGNLRATVQRIIALAKGDKKDPFRALRQWVDAESSRP